MGKGSSARIMLLIALAAGAAAFACQRSGSANQAATKSEDPPNAAVQIKMTAQAPTGDVPAPRGQAKYDEPQFSLSVVAPTDATKGATAGLNVVLVAKPPFHVNEEYPHRFRVIAARGLSTPAKMIQRDSAKVTKSRLEMAVPVTLDNEGPYGLDGEMGFSVCTNEKCLMEKRPLSIEFGPKS
ncbi:MAG TPA: hypothetical protein VKP30_10680 [Polyangiaceae bacterium]|nr:hypothetical protein [Polyangiaceae bacterium]